MRNPCKHSQEMIAKRCVTVSSVSCITCQALTVYLSSLHNSLLIDGNVEFCPQSINWYRALGQSKPVLNHKHVIRVDSDSHDIG